jgi:hypothetical protein
MKQFFYWGLTIVTLAFGSCLKDPQPMLPFSFDFSQQAHDWTVGFADYTDAYENLQLEGKIAPLPNEINPS